jgi:hypothetical protein
MLMDRSDNSVSASVADHPASAYLTQHPPGLHAEYLLDHFFISLAPHPTHTDNALGPHGINTGTPYAIPEDAF